MTTPDAPSTDSGYRAGARSGQARSAPARSRWAGWWWSRRAMTADTSRDRLSLAVADAAIAANPFPLADLGGVGGGFIRSLPGKTGRVTLIARHATVAEASVELTVT